MREEEQCEVREERECSVMTEQQCDTVNEQMCRTENMQVCETVNDQMCTANEVFILSSSNLLTLQYIKKHRYAVLSTSNNVPHPTANNAPHLLLHRGHLHHHLLPGPHHQHPRMDNKGVLILEASLMSREFPGLCLSPITEVVSRAEIPLRVGGFREVDRAPSTSLVSARLMLDHQKMSSKTLF